MRNSKGQFQKGQIPWNKGMPLSIKARQHLFERNLRKDVL